MTNQEKKDLVPLSTQTYEKLKKALKIQAANEHRKEYEIVSEALEKYLQEHKVEEE